MVVSQSLGRRGLPRCMSYVLQDAPRVPGVTTAGTANGSSGFQEGCRRNREQGFH